MRHKVLRQLTPFTFQERQRSGETATVLTRQNSINRLTFSKSFSESNWDWKGGKAGKTFSSSFFISWEEQRCVRENRGQENSPFPSFLWTISQIFVASAVKICWKKLSPLPPLCERKEVHRKRLMERKIEETIFPSLLYDIHTWKYFDIVRNYSLNSSDTKCTE